MQKQFKVLVLPGGTEIGLEIQKALAHCKEVRLFSASQDENDHASLVFAKHFVLPSVHESGWLESLNRFIERHQIDYVFPAHDDVILALVSGPNQIAAGVVTSPLETCRIARSKRETYRVLGDIVPVPRMYASRDKIDHYPVFCKPDRGQGSQDARLLSSAAHYACEVSADDLVMEYLPGPEYTVDCFSDRDTGLLYCAPRARNRIRGGISMRSTPVSDPVFDDYAHRISDHLVFHGAWFFQLKQDSTGTYKLLELAPRIPGTLALRRVQGVNLPLLSLYEQERIPVVIAPNDLDVQIDRALVNRYRHRLKYSAVYVDLDDTLILDHKVNCHLVRFFYQCLNKGIRLVLITRHDTDVNKTLHRYRLGAIFDNVIHVTGSDQKCDFIREPDAILIDDSFTERRSVRKKLGIRTFDCSMLEMLFDEKT